MALFGSRKRKVISVVIVVMFVHFLFTFEGSEKAGSPSAAVVEAAAAPAPLVQPTPAVDVAAEAERVTAVDDAAAEAERLAAAEEDAHDQRYGFTCLSLWDGSHERFIDAVTATLNDPDSFEHDSTKTWPVNAEGRNTILMTFRARNGFGGMVRGKASGSFDNASCGDVRVDLVE